MFKSRQMTKEQQQRNQPKIYQNEGQLNKQEPFKTQKRTKGNDFAGFPGPTQPWLPHQRRHKCLLTGWKIHNLPQKCGTKVGGGGRHFPKWPRCGNSSSKKVQATGDHVLFKERDGSKMGLQPLGQPLTLSPGGSTPTGKGSKPNPGHPSLLRQR